MDIGDRILVGAIVVSLVIGLLSLWQTRRLQNKQFEREDEIRTKEHRQKLLDEIISWAREVLECGRSAPTTDRLKDILDISTSESKYLLYRLAEVVDLHESFASMLRRSPYILKVAEGIKNDDVYNAIEQVRRFLKEHNDALQELRSVLSKKPDEYDEKAYDEARENTITSQSKVSASAQFLIAKVTDAKIELVG
jgi:hypothetical protein